MNDRRKIEIRYRDVIARRLPLCGSVGAVLLVMTVLLTLFLPSYYESRAVVLIEAQEIPQDMVRSVVTSFADQRIQVISRRVLTNSNLTTIIEKYNLYADDRSSHPLEVVLEEMQGDITVKPISAEVVDPKQGRSMMATIAFELAYENKSPELSQRVTNEIVSLFLNENLKQRTETSKETLDFLTSEAEEMRNEVAVLEAKFAKFKERNIGSLPELTGLNIEMMNRTEQEITQLEAQSQSLQEQHTYLESNLAEQKPSSVILAENGQRILGIQDRLKIAESNFVSLSAVYGPTHPDVIANRKEIDSLRAKVESGGNASEIQARLFEAEAEYATAAKKYSQDYPDVKRIQREIESLKARLKSTQQAPQESIQVAGVPDNPVYVQLQARLQATEADMQSLRGQINSKKAKVADFETRLTHGPEVEREYKELSRDYENAQLKYREVLAKKQEAEMASNLESKQRGERFTLIEPPVTPEEPSKPNRIAVLFLGVLFAVAGALGSGAIAESVDDSLYGRVGVVRVLGVPPLSVIPNLETKESIRHFKRKRRIKSLAVISIIIVLLVVVHLYFIPLDVLWFRALRRFGV